jgi:ribonuclease HI
LETLKKVFGKEKVKNLAIEARLDSELVCRQLNGEYQIKEEKLVPLFIKIWNLRVAEFKNLTFRHIPREENALADKLANRAMDEAGEEQGELF